MHWSSLTGLQSGPCSELSLRCCVAVQPQNRTVESGCWGQFWTGWVILRFFFWAWILLRCLKNLKRGWVHSNCQPSCQHTSRTLQTSSYRRPAPCAWEEDVSIHALPKVDAIKSRKGCQCGALWWSPGLVGGPWRSATGRTSFTCFKKAIFHRSTQQWNIIIYNVHICPYH